jgi:hypothetical protein
MKSASKISQLLAIYNFTLKNYNILMRLLSEEKKSGFGRFRNVRGPQNNPRPHLIWIWVILGLVGRFYKRKREII